MSGGERRRVGGCGMTVWAQPGCARGWESGGHPPPRSCHPSLPLPPPPSLLSQGQAKRGSKQRSVTSAHPADRQEG